MKQTKILIFFLAILFTLPAAGCARSSSPGGAATGSPGPDISDSPTSSSSAPVSPELAPSAADKVSISINFATDEILSNYDSYIDEYVASEYSIKIIISTNTAAKDFNYFVVGNREENSNIVFFVNQVLYSTDKLLPEKPLVIGAEFPGTLPTNGLSFVDENNMTRYFTVNESGKDGSLFLIEFQPE